MTMTFSKIVLPFLLLAGPLAGCRAPAGGDEDGDGDADSDVESDGDGDGDADGDIDTDGDLDTDGDVDADGDVDDADTDLSDGGGTPCGPVECDTATQVCVHVTSMMIDRYECRPIVAGCETDRTCACMAATCSPGPCNDVGPNEINCIGGRWMSCPFLYLFDGAGWTYHTDLAGSVLGAGLPIFRPQYYAGGFYWLGDIEPVEAVYRMRVRETIYEADFFDEAELVLVDAPEGYEVYNEWSFTSQLERTSPTRFFTVRDPRPPVSAIDAEGRDVLDEVGERDGRPVPVSLDGMSQVVVDFGTISRPDQARLIVTAWSFYADLSARQRPPFSAGTTIETLDSEGRWVVRLVAGKNPGDSHTWVIDIGGLVTAGDTRVRITLAHQPIGLDVLDQVLLDDSVQVPVTVRRVEPSLAELRYGGATRFEYSGPDHRISADDTVEPLIRDAVLSGDYTRYGDVLPLLGETDDRFVLMAHGDELELAFPAPPPVPGTSRHAFLFADVFYSIKYSTTALLTETNQPLPFHGMTSYPYPDDAWPYRDDPGYLDYMTTWNTRVVEAE